MLSCFLHDLTKLRSKHRLLNINSFQLPHLEKPFSSTALISDAWPTSMAASAAQIHFAQSFPFHHFPYTQWQKRRKLKAQKCQTTAYFAIGAGMLSKEEKNYIIECYLENEKQISLFKKKNSQSVGLYKTTKSR